MRLVPVAWSMAPWTSAAGTWTERRAQLVEVELDGARGTGEAAPLPGVSREEAAPFDAPATFPDEPAALAAALDHLPPSAAWGLFTAVLDARARARGVSIARLLAASPASRRPVAAVVDGAASAVLAVARGVGTLKVKIGGALGGVRDAAERIAAIRAAVGAGPAIRADANRGFPLADVPALLDALAPLDVELVEEPAIGWATAIRGLVSPPLAADESLADGWVDSPALAAVVLKPTVLGPARALAYAARARAAGLDVIVSHALEGPVGLAACAELALAVATGAAQGLDEHAGLRAWDVAIPTLGAGELVDAPRAGHGVVVERLP